MPDIPRTFSNASILGGTNFSTQAPQGAFGADMSSLGAAISGLGRSIVINKKTRDKIEEEDRKKEEAQWLNRSLSEYQRKITDFETNPENRSRVDYLPSFLANADNTASGYMEGAPSAESYDAFQEKAREIVDQRYGRSAALGANNEMQADIIAIDQSWGLTMQSYQSFAPIDPDSAANDLFTGLQTATDHVLELYGEIAPNEAKAMVTRRIVDTTLALIEKSPDKAKWLIDNNGVYIDQQTRQTLLNKIETKKATGSLLLKEDFNTVREKSLIAAERTGNYKSLPIEDYQMIYPGEEAQLMKQRDDQTAQASLDSHGFIAETKSMIPAEKLRLAKEFEDTRKTEKELRAFASIVSPALIEDSRLYNEDPVAWQIENNPTVQTIGTDMETLQFNETDEGQPGILPMPGTERGTGVGEAPISLDGSVKTDVAGIKQVPTMDQAVASREQYYRAILRSQGAAGEGEDPTRYMNRPRSEWRIMTKNEADNASAQINGADIDNVIQVVDSILSKYPSDDLRAQAISDLMTIPQNKIKAEYAIVFQNRDQPWLPEFIGNLRSLDSLTEMNKVDASKVKTSISSNGLWNSFKNTIIGPQDQRADEVKGYFNAIETDVKVMVAKGKKIEDAVDISINRILASTMKPTKLALPGMNDGPPGQINWDMWGNKKPQIWIPVQPEGFSRKLNQTEIDNYGQRMGVALANIHPDDIDVSQFPNFEQTEDKTKQQELIYNKIVKTGSYYPEPGGAYWRVTVESDSGQRVDLRDKEGRFFRLPLKNVPAYKRKGLFMEGLEMKGFTPDTWSWKETETFVDYPEGGEQPTPINNWKKTYPKTGAFWQFTR